MLPFAAFSACYFAHIGFFNPYLPLWLKDLGYDIVAISVLTSIQAATRTFAPYAWGALSDHTGERVVLMRYSATVALLMSLGLWLNLGFWLLLAVMFVMFVHTSSIMPMGEAAMAQLVSRGGHFDTRRYGRVRVWGSIGFLVTVFAAGAWFEHFGMHYFPAWSGVTLLALVLTVWWLPNTKEEKATHAVNLPVLPVLRQRAVQWFFASVFFHVLSHIAIYVFFSLYLDALGYSKTMIGVLWAVSVIVEIIWFVTQSRWLPLLSLSAWLSLCAAAMVLRLGLTAASASVLVVLVLAQALHALTFAAHHAVCIAWLSAHFPGQLRGRGQALYTVIGYGFPGVIGALAGGNLIASYGLASVYWASTGMSLIALGCAIQVWRTAPVPLADRQAKH
jgi:MFS transporter, PPP family, 3-phenylpropionic acid transporter